MCLALHRFYPYCLYIYLAMLAVGLLSVIMVELADKTVYRSHIPSILRDSPGLLDICCKLGTTVTVLILATNPPYMLNAVGNFMYTRLQSYDAGVGFDANQLAVGWGQLWWICLVISSVLVFLLCFTVYLVLLSATRLLPSGKQPFLARLFHWSSSTFSAVGIYAVLSVVYVAMLQMGTSWLTPVYIKWMIATSAILGPTLVGGTGLNSYGEAELARQAGTIGRACLVS